MVTLQANAAYNRAMTVKEPGCHRNIKMSSYQYRLYHYKDKTVSRPCILYNEVHMKTVFILRRTLNAQNTTHASLSLVSYGVPIAEILLWRDWTVCFMREALQTENMMTSSNGNIFPVTGPVWGESTGQRWIPLTKNSDAELWCFLSFVPEQTVEQTIGTPKI